MNTKPAPKHKTNQSTGLLIGIVVGIVISVIIALVTITFLPNKLMLDIEEVKDSDDEAKPLYWVAPMDANYRRDKPGKSPMGMELIPYYANTTTDAKDEGAGTINISPNVVNNLGVRTVSASLKPLINNITTVGYVTYDEDRLVHIHPRVSGWVEKLYVDAIGDTVKKGQPLYDLYSPELVNAQEEFLLALSGMNQRLINAAKSKLIALKVSLNTITKLKKTKLVQQHVTFYASQSGVIESLKIRSGFYVMPETMMLSIVDLSHVWVKADIFERDILNVNIGDSATMTLDVLPSKQWQGKVEHIHPMVNPASRTGIARLHFTNKDLLLKPNMFAQINISTASEESVLQIPREAVIRTGSQDRVVLSLGDGYFKSVAVSIGRSNQNSIEILSGLSVGEKVVSSAQFLLDSESSKTSDFSRMDASDSHNMKSDADQHLPTASVHGTVINTMTAHRMVSINREAIAKWNRGAATVDFIVDDAVDMSLFTSDAYLMFTFEIRDDEFVITKAMKMNDNSSHDQHKAEIVGGDK